VVGVARWSSYDGIGVSLIDIANGTICLLLVFSGFFFLIACVLSENCC